MHFTNAMNKITIALTFSIAASFAMADDNCVKPKVKGYNSDEMSCIGEGLVEVNNYEEAMIVNSNGQVIVPKGRYITFFKFSEGLAGAVNTDYKAGYIDKTGKVIIPFSYAPAMTGEGGEVLEVNPFKEGLAAVIKRTNDGNEKSGFIDKTGKTIIPFKYGTAGSFSSGMAPVAIEQTNADYSQYVWGYIDKSGKTIIPFTYDYAGSFSDSVAVVMKGEKYGVINTKGIAVVPFKYEYMNDFSNGLAAVFQKGKPIKNSDSVRGKFGFIDKTGKVVIPIQYEMDYYGELNLPSFENGKAKIDVWINDVNKSYCINKKGAKVTC